MFDKLVESDLNGADLKPRRRIFVASFLFVGVLFATAVVVGIYAADYTLSTDNFDLTEMLVPVTATEPAKEPEPEPVRHQQSSSANAQNNQTVRRVIMASTEDPSRVPDRASAEVNPYRSVSADRYTNVKTGPVDLDAAGQGGTERNGTPGGSTSAARFEEPDDEATRTPPPLAPKIEKKPTVKSGGVVNGTAIDLPKPAYSAAAQAVKAAGAVNVQVMIDESGKVISAKAISGHVMLRREAESAAWRARFKPTTLSNVPVKVSGIIVYNFTR